MKLPNTENINPTVLTEQLHKIGWISLGNKNNIYVFTNGDRVLRVDYSKELSKLKYCALLVMLHRYNKELKWKMEKEPYLFTGRLRGVTTSTDHVWNLATFVAFVLLIYLLVFF